MYITRKHVFEWRYLNSGENADPDGRKLDGTRQELQYHGIPYEDNGTSLVMTEYMGSHTDISNGGRLEMTWTRYKTMALSITKEMAERLFNYENTSEDKSRWIFVEEV